MADSKLANLLRNDNAWKGDADLAAFNQFEAQAEPWYRKGLPMEGRGTFLPFRDTLPDSVMNQREWALPSIIAAPINAITAPFRAATGSDATFNAPEEAMNLAGSVFGGGVGTSRAMTTPMGVGGKDLALNAWHGTPHEVKGQFDLAKVGTGEGAQAYGYGTYFAENPMVAKEYQKMLAGPEQTASDYLKMYKTPKTAISALQESISPNLTPEAKKFAQDAIDVLKSGKPLIGNLYKVDIPDAAIPNMLDWDKPLSQQQHIWDKLPQDVRNSIDDALENSGRTSMSDALGDYKGRHLYKALEHHEVHESLPPQIGNSDWFKGDTSPAQHTSAFLNSLGVTGVKYLDQASRKDGKGTSNFVVFDPSTVKILEKNDKPVDRKELIKKQIDKLTE